MISIISKQEITNGIKEILSHYNEIRSDFWNRQEVLQKIRGKFSCYLFNLIQDYDISLTDLNGNFIKFFIHDFLTFIQPTLRSESDVVMLLKWLNKNQTLDNLNNKDFVDGLIYITENYKSIQIKLLLTRLLNKPLEKENRSSIGWHKLYIYGKLKRYDLMKQYESHRSKQVRSLVIRHYLQANSSHLNAKGIRLLKKQSSICSKQEQKIKELLGEHVMRKWKND